jgi:heterodisulfide reductase subunit C
MKKSTDHAACSGCSLCLLVCPMWRHHRDISLTAHGYAKALQHGAHANEIATALWSCTLCGACDPVCPEQIDVTGMILKLRRQLAHPDGHGCTPGHDRFPLSSSLPQAGERGKVSLCEFHIKMSALQARMQAEAVRPLTIQHPAVKLLPDQALRESPERLARIADLLGISVAEDDGADIALALEAGVVIPPQRLQRFLATWRGLHKIIIADGLLLKHLKQLLPKMNFVTLGEALSTHAAVRRSLRASDLYVIEPRAYHADYQRLVKHYDCLRTESGSAFNLDLQRIAIPATSRSLPQRLGLSAADDEAQARWVLHGRSITRIVVESLEDRAALEKVSDVPVVHLVDLLIG